MSAATFLIRLYMTNEYNSLNLASNAIIILYETLRSSNY